MSTTTLREQLETAVKGLEKFADELDEKGEAPSAEDLENIRNRCTEIASLKEQVKNEAELKGELADAKSFLKSLSGDAEQTASDKYSVTQAGMAMDPKGKTFGELFTESEAYGDFIGRYAGKSGVIPNSMKGIQSGPFQTPDLKALLTGTSSTSAGALVVNDRYPGITDLVGERELTVRDLVTIGRTESDTVEYVRTTAKTNNAATVAEATTSAAPTVVNTEGTPNIAVVTPAAGGGYKPESSMALEVVSATVKTIAHWMPLTKRAASDASQVRTLVDNFLRYGLNEELEDQMLNGGGTGEDFEGISTAVTQTVGSAGTDIDAIVDAIKTVRYTGRRKPTAVVFHPNDWYSTGFLLAKDGVTGGYLIGDPRASVEQLNQLWGLQVVVSEAQTENTAIVGDFRQAVLWEREGVSLTLSDQHADFFVRNLLAVLAEMRAAFGVLDVQAFCEVTAL
jgi:hypothetical protein